VKGRSLVSAAGMVDTPWGPSESLRERRLRPGPGTPADEVARNQRERLFGAMVASVYERGYAATRLGDLAEISGVSLSSYYALFPDKQACFVAAIEAMVASTMRAVDGRGRDYEELVRGSATAFAELVTAHPAAARMCLVEAYAVGPAGLRPLEEATAKVETELLEAAEKAGHDMEALPAMISALVGALLGIAREWLRRGKEARLPALMDDFAGLILSYQPPPEPLRLSIKLPTPAPETIEAHDHIERALRALAVVVGERGYSNTTVKQIVHSASMSPKTFYSNFRDKEDALMAAIDGAGAQTVAATLPAFHRNRNWPHGVRAAFGAFFNFLASRPALARLVMVEVYAAGSAAVSRREESLLPLDVLLEEGRGRSPEVPSIAREVIAGAVYSLAYRQIRDSGPESLPQLAPICTYLTLAPFIGAEEACAAANGDGRSRAPDRDAIRAVGVQATLGEVLDIVSWRHGIGAEEIARQIEITEDAATHYLDELEAAGLIGVIGEQEINGKVKRFYGSELRRLDGDDWTSMELPQRRRISEQIGHLIKGEWDGAVEAGSFDARPDRHMSRLSFLVDEQGWRELLETSDRALDSAIEIRRQSAERLEKSREKGIDGRIVQLLFEMPERDQRQG
jgi:AcrR family transcriptional regulator